MKKINIIFTEEELSKINLTKNKKNHDYVIKKVKNKKRKANKKLH